jgi:hypothetical protein
MGLAALSKRAGGSGSMGLRIKRLIILRLWASTFAESRVTTLSRLKLGFEIPLGSAEGTCLRSNLYSSQTVNGDLLPWLLCSFLTCA